MGIDRKARLDPGEDFITRFTDYAADEFCVISEVHDATAVRYMVLIKVSSLGVPYETTQRSPDGSETETLRVTLRRGDGALIADFSHSVAREGAQDLRFSGTTLLPGSDWE